MTVRKGSNIIAGNPFIVAEAPIKVVSDFNSIDGAEGKYFYVNSTQDVTLNTPVNLTTSWIVEVTTVTSEGVIIQKATNINNAAMQLIRVYKNSTWSSWIYSYSAWNMGY